MKIPFVWALCLIATWTIGGCAGSGPVVGLTVTGITSVQPTVHAIMGQILVVPVQFGSDVSPIEPITARLDDGRDLQPEVFWISAAPSPTRYARWLADPGVWSATSVTAGSRPSAIGYWVMVVDLPVDAVGQGIWIDHRRWPINWLDHPGLLAAIASPVDPTVLASDQFQLLAETEAKHPMLRFRSRLIAGDLGAIDVPGRASLESHGSRFNDPVIEALAVQKQARWAAGLNQLALADAELAARLSSALCRTAELEGAVVPAWATNIGELDELLGDLLDPRRASERRSRLVAGWLDSQPSVVAWIADDAGLSDAISGQSVSSVAAANIGEKAQLVSLSLTGGDIDLQRVEPGEYVRSQLPCPPDFDRVDAILARVQVQANLWSVPILAEPIPVVPPGAGMSPMYVDRTLSQWRRSAGGAGRPLEEAGGAAALLMRTTYADPLSDSAEETWAIYAECITGEGPIAGSVRVWIGPSGAPLAVLTVFADGTVEEERVRRVGAAPVKDRVSVVRRDDRWSCLIPLPKGAIDSRGIVRIGIEHVGSDGVRSAWPRPMFPWQVEPARAAFDTTAWGSLSIFGGRE